MALAVAALMVPSTMSGAAAEPEPGDTVWVGPKLQGYGGTGIHGVWENTPADPGNPGTPEYWAYCIEQPISARSNATGTLGNVSSFLGDNYFTDPVIQGKVLWVLAHSYPALSLSAFGTAAGVPGIALNDAIEATQYAIWRYTDLNFDAPWAWENDDSRDAYWYLVNGANASGGMAPGDFATTASVTGPAGAQTADSLVGPFTVSTNQPTASVTVSPAVPITNAAGTAIDASAVTNGQQVYLDLRGTQTAGSATVTVSAKGSNVTGKIVSTGKQNGQAPTEADHAQSLILVAPSTSAVSDQAQVSWNAVVVPAGPSIGTTLVDDADGDKVLAWDGGVVVDTVAYENLTPGTEYTVEGELMRKSDGSGTGITGSATFTPTTPNGTVEVSFTVPKGHAGEVLVAFEYLYVVGGGAGGGDLLVATHDDIDDAAQTVRAEEEPDGPTDGPSDTPTTGTPGDVDSGTDGPDDSDVSSGDLPDTGAAVSPWLLALGAFAVGGGGLLAFLGRKRRVRA